MKIEWHTAAIKDLKVIDRAVQLRIHKALQELSRLDDPGQKLVAYSGTLANFWKLRVGDYRLVCQILRQDDELILIVRLANRRDVYKPVQSDKDQEQDGVTPHQKPHGEALFRQCRKSLEPFFSVIRATHRRLPFQHRQ